MIAAWNKFELLFLLVVLLMALIVSAIYPHDALTWVMEVFPILLGVPILIVTFSRFRFTPLVYRLIFVHSLILVIGAHYTYARVPIGYWAQEVFHLARNHYDRLGHLAQGFFPAIIVREILLRTSPLVKGKWLFFIVCSICLSVSAFYEFIEWWAAVLLGKAADSFLGTQGDPWDTQWDMFLAFIGSVGAQAIFVRIHDRMLKEMNTNARTVS